MVPDTPPVTKSPFPYVTSQSLSDAPEVLLSQVVPSEEVRMVPESPTVTNNPVEVVVLSVVVLSVLVVLDVLLDEEQDMEMKLKRRREMRMSSRCFTWFPISGLGKPKLYQNMWCFTRIGEVSAKNTKYAEHYTYYGYSFRIYGDFEEILK